MGTSLVFPAAAGAGQTVNGTVAFTNSGPYQAQGVTYGLTLTPGLTGVTFTNLPAGATATYDATTGLVIFTGMPTTLEGGTIASGDRVTPIGVSYVQNSEGVSTVTSGIATTTNEGADVKPNKATANIGVEPVADVFTSTFLPIFSAPGDAVSGGVLYCNAGPSTAAGMSYALTITAGLAGVTFGNLPAGATATYDAATGVVTFTGMPTTLAAGTCASGDGINPISLGYVQPPGSSTITSTVGTTTSQGGNAGADTSSSTTPSEASVGVAKASSVSGDTIVYDIKLKSAGPAPAYSVSLVDDLDAVFGAGNYVVVAAPPSFWRLPPARWSRTPGTPVRHPPPT